MPTLRAINLRGREGVELGFLVSDHLDLGGGRALIFSCLLHGLRRRLAGVAAVVADVRDRYLPGALDLFELEASTTLGTELQRQLEPPPRAFLAPSKSAWVVSMALSTLLANAFSGFIRWALTFSTSFLISG